MGVRGMPPCCLPTLLLSRLCLPRLGLRAGWGAPRPPWWFRCVHRLPLPVGSPSSRRPLRPTCWPRPWRRRLLVSSASSRLAWRVCRFGAGRVRLRAAGLALGRAGLRRRRRRVLRLGHRLVRAPPPRARRSVAARPCLAALPPLARRLAAAARLPRTLASARTPLAAPPSPPAARRPARAPCCPLHHLVPVPRPLRRSRLRGLVCTSHRPTIRALGRMDSRRGRPREGYHGSLALRTYLTRMTVFLNSWHLPPF